MASYNTSLANLWVNDAGGQASPLKTIVTSAGKVSGSGSDLKEEMVQYYKDSGLDCVAKEAGILDLNGELTSFKQEPVHTKTVQMITVPMQSPLRAAATIAPSTPKTVRVATPVHTATSPMLISPAPQGGILQASQVVGGHHVTAPQYIATPVQIQSPSPNWGRKRNIDIEGTPESESKRRRNEKGGKGLRHFSMKVCEKVQKKGTTSYNEVADELVAEFADPSINLPEQGYDQKNIRRRVYDALNVLMAMNIISKEKKEIRWIGLPANSAQECQNLELEKQRRLERIQHKTQQLQELILQQIAFKRLVERNRQVEQCQGLPSSNSAIQLPFILVNTSKKTVIDCSISSDKYEYLFNFNNTFEIHDDIEVLKRMGLAFGLEKGMCSQQDLKTAVKMVPKSLEPYVIQLAQKSQGLADNTSGITPLPSTSHDQSLDAEVAMATGSLSGMASRQSSVASFSRGDSPDDDGFSDECDSNRSSPILEI